MSQDIFINTIFVRKDTTFSDSKNYLYLVKRPFDRKLNNITQILSPFALKQNKNKIGSFRTYQRTKDHSAMDDG